MINTHRLMQVIATASLCQALDLELRGMDTTWPEDNCCRIYSKNEFKGKKRDFCTDSPYEEKVIDLTGDRWNNRMMSWKCGRNTAATFCDEADARDCETDFDFGESAGGGAES